MTEDQDIVLLEKKDHVAYVTLNRPDVRNAFNEYVIARLSDLFDELAEDKTIRVVVLRGAGKSFSAGADLTWMRKASSYTEEENKKDALALAGMLNRLYTMPQLTVACVQGAAMGGGLGLVACCDMVISEVDTLFALSEVKLGLIPATIAPYVLAALGPRQCRRFFQTGQHFTGAKAYDLGLVHELAGSAEEIEGLVEALLEAIELNGPQAMRAAKKLCLDLAGQPVCSEMLEDTASRIAAARVGAEAKEGITAFLEKRKPEWDKE